ncbi:MAG TPA: apolipoprotein N-acyltransferase [Acidobacteriota bacterium]|nr:apolipoprotein N-acyltransferase [Acidobacteriota bacterium]
MIAFQFFLPVLSAALLAAPFLNPLLFPLGWVAFVPLFWTLGRATSWRRAVFDGWLMGLVAHMIGFHWLVYTISAFGGFAYPVSVVVFIVYAGLQAIQMAIFALLVHGIGFGPLAIFPALFWVPLEFLFPLLFPWHIANSQVSFLSLIQSADLVGPYGVGFVIMWCNAAIYHALFAPKRDRAAKLLPIAYAGLSVIVSLVYGYQRLEVIDQQIASARKLSVGAVQGNVDIDMKWNPVLAQKNLDQHHTLTAGLFDVQLVVWPESAIEAMIPDDFPALPQEYMPSLKSPRASFIFGAKSFTGRPGRRDIQAFNTAFMTDARGNILSRYHKQVLLAFGEYLPFAKILSLLPAMPFADGFTAGAGPVVFFVSRGVRAAPLICYEDLMPELSRKFVSETRANLLVNLTNDAWYGKSIGPWQHLWLAQSRAIETRRSLLRVTNTGVTSLVNAKGEIVKTLPMFTPAVMQTDVDILDEETYYVRFGDWFAWGITIVVLGIVLFHLKRKMNQR